MFNVGRKFFARLIMVGVHVDVVYSSKIFANLALLLIARRERERERGGNEKYN